MAKAAILIAGTTNPLIDSKLIPAKVNLSSKINFCGISPITSTGKLNNILTIKATISPIKDDGTFAFHFLGHRIIIATTSNPISIAYILGFIGPLTKLNTFIIALSEVFVVTPKKLSSCPIAIVNAIPDVKPVITGSGI